MKGHNHMQRRTTSAGAACIAALFLFGGQLRGEQARPELSQPSILAIMERVADWQLANPSSWVPTDWTQGAGYTGFMALAGISANPAYRDAMRAMGERNNWAMGPLFYHADDECVGQTYAELYLLYREPKMIAPLEARLDGVMDKPSTVKSLELVPPYERTTENWSWCDALFMAPPTWLRLYAATGDTRYRDFAIKNWWRTTDFLYDRGEHLFYRDSNYFQKREANGQKVFWGRGNGWVMAGVVRMLQYLPMNDPERPRFERLLTEMSAKVLTCQQSDGLWRASLLDPGSYPLRETSGSGFFAYALAWGVNQGILDRDRYLPAILKAWSGLCGCVEANGKLAHVQPIGADPKAFPEESTEAYGVGAFLLAGSEIYRLAAFEEPPNGTGNGTSIEIAAVTNPSSYRRQQETIEIDLAGIDDEGIAVMDGLSSRIIDSQVCAPQPGKTAGLLLFQVDLAPGETRNFCILNSGARLSAIPKPIVKTYARQVTERSNDIAWESDRIAHRMYHVDLIKEEGTVSSGIDVWTKRTRNLVINEWYKRPNYHEDVGDGLDDYHVSRSRGCGGLGIWSGGRLYVSSNYRSARILTTGPIRSEFILDYDAWDAAGRRVSESKQISIDAGSNMSRVESVFSSDDKSPIQVGIGIAQRAGPGNFVSEDRDAGWMTYWQAPDRDRGEIGCAVILPAKSIQEFVTESATVGAVPLDEQLKPDSEGLPPISNLLAITKAEVGKGLVYFIGAGWTRSGDFPNEDTWTAYVRHFAGRRKEPIKVLLKPWTRPSAASLN
jgi:rhamnogalacturonyl hydrolase YesR